MVKYLDQALKFLLMLTVVVLTVSVFLQVLTRFVIKMPLPWTEEASRIAFVYSIFIGATLGIREKAHINVDVIVAILPARGRFIMKMVSNALVAVLLCFIVWQGTDFVRQTGVQMTPVLLIPFTWLYPIIPLSGAIMLLYLALDTIEDVRRARTT